MRSSKKAIFLVLFFDQTFLLKKFVVAKTYSQINGQQLCTQANAFRIEQGLSPLPLSYTMETIAQTHLDNLVTNGHNPLNMQCNLHSWYPETIYNTVINKCCYPSDPCMTTKAQELTTGWLTPYKGAAAENTFFSSGSGFNAQASANRIIESWKVSSKHRALLLSNTAMVCGAVLNYTFVQSAVNSLALL